MTDTEVITCPVCGVSSPTFKIRGTMPRGWFAFYIGPGNYPRVCSIECMETLKKEMKVT